MPADNEETQSLALKLAVYIGGVLLGLAAKLAVKNKEKNLTKAEIIMHSLVAFAAAYFTWSLLDYWHMKEISTPASVIVGRFGDNILMAAWKMIQTAIKSKTNTNI